ncbi:PspC domain-containing protein [Dyadobacter psychrotolerans]|uniref:PspC domain-containing protein n=1 Tax=Dyadobacter psychrotolerans TaxID=2541721 RepID=A0A4V2Z3G5_9BACT|nr:PspC domain-containing protein [Dyadobacter psychrotolerans]TDE12068.1 PspC domain-containing protein [Dyadobacter psychrotolerans]
MKKTISINIGGSIFHIEEDGYEKLKGYLSAIQKYFSSFEDSKEILSDIEGRIAERFLNKQKAESKQVISLTDVDELIAAMGTVADFEAIEQAEDILADPLAAAAPKSAPREEIFTSSTFETPKTENFKSTNPKKLYRDLRRKLAGGVAAGLAHYFTIDPLWVRLAFLFAVIGLPAGSGIFNLDMEDEFGPFSGFMVLVYIAMWVAFPGSSTLEEDTKIKKFYRDPDRKVVGGVAAGVASYFGVDLGVVRFLWVLSILFFGTGFLIYIVLWIIAPVAHTLTEKMEMQGEPITLSNIESNIKQSLNLDEKTGEENALSKILLFPFRAIALIIGALGKLLKGLGPVLRILVGIFLVGVSALALISLVIAGGIMLGFTNAAPFEDMPIPMRILQEIPASLTLSGFLVAAVPLATFLLLGLTLLSNKKIVGSSVWLTLLGLWIVGSIVSTVQGISFSRNFAKRGDFVTTAYYPVPNGTLTLDQNDEDDDENVDVDIYLAGFSSTDSLKLEKKAYSRGRTREDAGKLASEMQYEPEVKDSVFLFREGPEFGKGDPFRNQEIDVTLHIPYDRPFAMTSSFWNSVSHRNNSYHHLDNYDLNDDDVNWTTLRWVMRRDSGLVCINLPEKFISKNNSDNQEDREEYNYDDENSELNLGERGNYIKKFPVGDFQKLDMGGAYSISIRQGAEFNVSADGEEEDVDDLQVSVENGTLHVKRSKGFSLFDNKSWNRVGLIITMPTIESVSLSGANKARISGFTGLSKLNIDVSGASKTEVNVGVSELVVELTGASKAKFTGNAKSANFDLSGACKLDATAMNFENVDIDASGASKAEFGRVVHIKKSTSGASKIEVRE